ncbi:MAG: hypothetical protein QM608_14675, partial [Caulobacter sp.]
MFEKWSGLFSNKDVKEISVDYCIDEFNRKIVTGWAWCPNSPRQPLVIEFFDSVGAPVGRTEAADFREDLLTAGKGDGHCAFAFPIPDELQNSGNPLLGFRILQGTHILHESDPEQLSGSVELFVDLFQENVISGWGWRSSDPDERLSLEFLDGGNVIGSSTADQFREDLLLAGKGDGRHAFTFRMPPEFRGDAGKAVGIRLRGDDTVLASISRDPAALPAELYVDGFDGHGLKGWGWLPLDPEERLQLEFLDEDGRVIGETIADGFREDLAANGKGDGRYAFRFELPIELYDGQKHAIGIRRKGWEELLHVTNKALIGELCSDFDCFLPHHISGSLWISERHMHSVDYQVVVDGKIVHEGHTDAHQRIEWTGDIASILDAAGNYGSTALEMSVELRVLEQVVRSERLDIATTSARDLAIVFTKFSMEEIGGWLLTPGTPNLALWINDRRACEIAPGPDGAFSIALDMLHVDDGEHMFRIGQVPQLRDSVGERLNYRRLDATVDIVDGLISGTIVDRWSTDIMEVGVEVIIDGHPIALVVARSIDEDNNSVRQFEIRVSNRWRDGQPHVVQCRLAGSKVLFPPRPVMFRASEPQARNLTRAELLLNDHISGWAIAVRTPGGIADVTLLKNGETLSKTRADRYHPALAADSMVPVNRGFDFDLSSLEDGEYEIDIRVDGHQIGHHRLCKESVASYRLQNPGHGREGVCFVLPDPHGTVQDREEARALLFSACAAARAETGQTITLVFAKQASGLKISSGNLKSVLEGLIGQGGAEALKHAHFTTLAPPPMPAGTFGHQTEAYHLDLWLRANSFSRLVTTSRYGVAAYCAASRRQGLSAYPSEIVTIVDNFAIVDNFEAGNLLERPNLLFDEALEREVLKASDLLIAHNRLTAERCEDVMAGASGRVKILPLPITISDKKSAFSPDSDVKWLLFTGPLQLASGLATFCNALDRLARRPGIKRSAVGVAFVGPEDVVRGKKASAYIRARAKKWPFHLRIFPNLAWDTLGDVLKGFARQRAIAVNMPQLEGTIWAGLSDAAGLSIPGRQDARPGNATDLADVLEKAIAGDVIDTSLQSVNSLGMRLAAPVAPTPLSSLSSNERRDDQSPLV